MPPTDDNGHSTENEGKFSVGWQRLTRQEFLEAISAALLDKVQKVQRHELEQSGESGEFPQKPAESAD
ncbi:MAG: hypothetical protein ABSA57_04805 [Candidatus Acidiferrales bacterium]|jgi:hypothetical protein